MDFGPTVILQASSATVVNSSGLVARSDLSGTIKSLLRSRDYCVKSGGGKPSKMLCSSIARRRDPDGSPRVAGNPIADNNNINNCAPCSKAPIMSNHFGVSCQNVYSSEPHSTPPDAQSESSPHVSKHVNSQTILEPFGSESDLTTSPYPIGGYATPPITDQAIQRLGHNWENKDAQPNNSPLDVCPDPFSNCLNGTETPPSGRKVASQERLSATDGVDLHAVEDIADRTNQSWSLPAIKPNQSQHPVLQANRSHSANTFTTPSPSRSIVLGRSSRNVSSILRPSKRSPPAHELTNRMAVENSYELKSRENSLSSEHMGNKTANRKAESADHLGRLNNRTGSAGPTQVIPDVNGLVEDAITTVNVIRPRIAGGQNAATTTTSFASDPRSRTCCFCWCCCCSCSCMRVKHNLRQSKSPSASNDLQSKLDELESDEKLTLEEVKSWSDSFDLLMQSPGGRKVFREFLRSEYSEENILFWLACEELKKETNPELVEEKARMIYEDFISILSPREVSLDSRVRELINANMIEPTPGTFDEAQLQIYTLMHRDSYLRFLNSKVYKDLLQQTTPEDCVPTESVTSCS